MRSSDRDPRFESTIFDDESEINSNVFVFKDWRSDDMYRKG